MQSPTTTRRRSLLQLGGLSAVSTCTSTLTAALTAAAIVFGVILGPTTRAAGDEAQQTFCVAGLPTQG